MHVVTDATYSDFSGQGLARRTGEGDALAPDMALGWGSFVSSLGVRKVTVGIALSLAGSGERVQACT